MHLPRELRVPLDRVSVRRFLLAVAALNVFFLVGTFFGWSWGGVHWRVRFLGEQLNLALENNLGAWYSAMLLLTVAAAMLLCFALDRREERADAAVRPGVSARVLTFGWLLLCLVFMLLSLDELGSLHERVDDLPWVSELIPGVADLGAWVAVLALPIAVVAAGMLAFGWTRVRESRAAAVCMTGAVLLFLSVPVQEHFEGGMRHASGMGRLWPRPPIHAVAEEGAEVFGSLLFLAAAVIYARMRWQRIAGARRDTTTEAPTGVGPEEAALLQLRAWHVAALVGFMTAGLVGVHVLLPHLMYVEDGRGVPQNWFPASLGFIAAAFCFTIGRRTQRRALPLFLLAALNLGFSINHGTDYVWQEAWFASGRFLPGAGGLLLHVAVLGGAALFAAARMASGTGRAAVFLWAGLLLVALHAGDDGLRTILSFAGYIALLAGLFAELPVRPSVQVAEPEVSFR